MSRTINCIVLKAEAEGLDYAPYPGELGAEDLRQRFQRGLAALARSPDDADQRIPPDANRTGSTQVSRNGNGEVFLWRRLGRAEGICA